VPTPQRRECRRADGLPAINSAIFDSYRRLPMPTIGLVDACALGDGAELAFACDFRVGALFVWTTTAESILTKIRRGRVALSQTVSQ